MRLTCVTLWLLFSLFASVVQAEGNEASGAKLFRSTELGTNGRSCSSCHPGGKGLAEIADFDDVMLRDIVNACIRDAMKGQLLPEGSEALGAIVEYVRQFQRVQ